MSKSLIAWILAVIITLSAAYYQRLTGPTHPKRVEVNIGGKDYKLKLLRSSENDEACFVKIKVNDPDVKGTIYYHRFNINEPYTGSPLTYDAEEEYLKAELPVQPAAGKLQYYVELVKGEDVIEIAKDNPIVIRFKDPVPTFVLAPHIIFMFAAMLISTLAGLMVVFKHDKYKFYGKLAFYLLLVGGMILGPFVQKYAFGDFWTGVPFGWDLTDNKTLIAFIAWIVALLVNRKKDRPYAILIAAIILLLIYSIPHSMFGSELDYTTGNIGQG